MGVNVYLSLRIRESKWQATEQGDEVCVCAPRAEPWFPGGFTCLRLALEPVARLRGLICRNKPAVFGTLGPAVSRRLRRV
jgi:hypothetical protein